MLDRLPTLGTVADRSVRLRALMSRCLALRNLVSGCASVRARCCAWPQRPGAAAVAEQLFISYNTVKSHLKTSYRKLGVT